MGTTQQNDELEIDLGQLLMTLRSHLFTIIICGLLGGLVALIGTKLLVTPLYVSDAKLYVLNKTGDTTTVTSSDLQSSTYLVEDYVSLCTTRAVVEKTIAELGLDMSYGTLLGKLSVTAESESRVITIQVTDPDPYTAAEICAAITEIASEHIQSIVGVEAVQTADEANVPTSPSNDNTQKNALIGVLAGVVLAAAVIVVVFLANDTLRSSEDVERYLSLNLLGSIPMQENERKRRRSGGRKNRNSGMSADSTK